jgi:hypothetical protein
MMLMAQDNQGRTQRLRVHKIEGDKAPSTSTTHWPARR